MIARVAETFKQLPTVVARDLDEDPERLSLLCVTVLQYTEAYYAEKRAKDPNDLKAWRDSHAMKAVLRNKFALKQERVARQRQEREANGD